MVSECRGRQTVLYIIKGIGLLSVGFRAAHYRFQRKATTPFLHTSHAFHTLTDKEMRTRIPEIDLLKCVCIILMVLFHLVYIGNKYPDAKAFVYVFHMPVFLIISGYLANMDKSLPKVGRQMLWIFVPYAVMETGYIAAATVLPIREHIDSLTPALFFKLLLVSPIGPYWYLHTLLVCYAAYYAVHRVCHRLDAVSYMAVLILLFFGISRFRVCGEALAGMANMLYFSFGVLLKRFGARFASVFLPSWVAVLPVVWLCAEGGIPGKDSAEGAAITFLMMCLLLAVWRIMPARVTAVGRFIGTNTLPILLFSPVFTILVKPLSGILSFDGSGILFAIIGVSVSVAGSMLVAAVMDRTGLSVFFCGKKHFLSRE